MEHSSLSQDVLVKENEIKKIQNDYKESISSMDSASKALMVSQRELEKYKSLNKKLIDELDELKFKMASAVKISKMVSEAPRRVPIM
ncbi:CBM_collapsed_G0026800.mRNA.1.CDS.1 [Saccharomyces cerevisiae]|nr:CBM_collapsed_G0026800.mRNA.1.CDS.1 [Saccharomyces cerevisiae]